MNSQAQMPVLLTKLTAARLNCLKGRFFPGMRKSFDTLQVLVRQTNLPTGALVVVRMLSFSSVVDLFPATRALFDVGEEIQSFIYF
jgi:hypothetical protein